MTKNFETIEDFVEWATTEEKWLEVDDYIRKMEPGHFLDALVEASRERNPYVPVFPYSTDSSCAIGIIEERKIGLSYDRVAREWGAHNITMQISVDTASTLPEAVSKVAVIEWVHQLKGKKNE